MWHEHQPALLSWSISTQKRKFSIYYWLLCFNACGWLVVVLWSVFCWIRFLISWRPSTQKSSFWSLWPPSASRTWLIRICQLLWSTKMVTSSILWCVLAASSVESEWMSRLLSMCCQCKRSLIWSLSLTHVTSWSWWTHRSLRERMRAATTRTTLTARATTTENTSATKCKDTDKTNTERHVCLIIAHIPV